MTGLTTTVAISCAEDEALVQKYALFLQESRALALATPMHQLIDVCEAHVVKEGREVTRAMLEGLVQQRLEEAEKKGASCVSVRVEKRKRIAGRESGRS